MSYRQVSRGDDAAEVIDGSVMSLGPHSCFISRPDTTKTRGLFDGLNAPTESP